MSMKFNTTLPSPTELKEEYPLSEKLAELKDVYKRQVILYTKDINIR